MPRRPLRASFNGSRGRREPEKGFKNHAISRPSEFGGGRTNDDDDDDDGVSSHKGKARNSLSNGARTDRKWWIEKKRKGVKGTLLTISFPSLNRFRRDASFSYGFLVADDSIINEERDVSWKGLRDSRDPLPIDFHSSPSVPVPTVNHLLLSG